MADNVDKMLEVAATPDWISPLWAMFQDLRNGPKHDFFVDRYADWSAKDVTRLLKKTGIKTWGTAIIDDMIFFSVKKQQALWAQRILQSNGIPIIAGYIPIPKKKPNSAWYVGPLAPKTSPKPVSLFEQVDNLFDRMDSILDRLG